MSIDSLAPWLRCPACGQPLEPIERLTLGCVTGHRFDVNKRGYVNLVSGGTKLVGDSTAMLEARDRVLESGLYSPIAAAIAAAAEAALELAVRSALPSDSGGRAAPRILDAGVGTGYYLRAALSAVEGARGLAMDLSPHAVARAVRSSANTDGLVADTWRPLPLRDAVCDLILDVFAPRNLPEFHRALAPAGSLLVVVPLAEHLAELRADARMLDVPADKSAEIVESAVPRFSLHSTQTIRSTIPLSATTADALVAMGPSAHHARTPSGTTPTEATLAVELLHLRRA